MSFIQKLFKALLPAKSAASMEADSRSWMMRCPECGYEKSIWDMGGIKWKAKGESRNFQRCIQCGKRSWHKLYRKREEHETQEKRP